MRRTGFLLQPTWRLEDGRPVVQLFGRCIGEGGARGPAFLVEDDRFRPYAFVAREAERPLARERGLRVEPCGLRDLRGRAVLRVETATPGGLARLREKLGSDAVLEADLRFPYRVLIDLGIRSGLAIDGDPSPDSTDALLRFRNPDLAPAAVEPDLAVVSLDIETTPDASELIAFALHGAGADEVHVVTSDLTALRTARSAFPRSEPQASGEVNAFPRSEPQASGEVNAFPRSEPQASGEVTRPDVHAHRDEAGLVRALLARIAALDPDVLVGWNVVDFDLRVVAARCEALGLAPDLGRVPGPIAFQEDRGFTRQTRALVAGRMVLDGVGLVRDALRLEDYRLETVAQHVLGRGKKLDRDAPDAALEIQRLHREDPAALAAYNLEDARLALEILEHEGLVALAVERSLLSGMQLDRVGASIASFDLLYLPELRRRGYVAPSVEARDAGAAAGEGGGPVVQGGALLDPVPGFHANVAVFDFKSLYPSLIRTFDLDPLAHALAAEGPGSESLTAPNGARFRRGAGILPRLVERFGAARAAARERGDPHAAQAIKIMLNALFGVLGATGCRFFDPAVANAITSFGQQTLRWTRDAFVELGVRVLYGDTDSVFVAVDDRAAAEPLRARAERRVAQRIRAEYGVEPHLELEADAFYERLLLPRLRGGRGASHKRYAGLEDGRLVVVGLESVRRDWPAVAARLQEGMLLRAFTDQPVAPFVRAVVEQVESGALDAELVYAKRVRKASLDRYTATTPPHVQAARKQVEQGVPVGPVVRYAVTASGPEPVLPGRPLPPAIDRRHYVAHVLRPIAEAILIERGESFDEAIGRPKPRQLPLL